MLDKNNPCVSNLAQCGLTLEKLEKLSVKSNLGVSFTEDLGRFSKKELFKELQTVTDRYNNEAILATIDIPFRIKDLNSMLHNYERYYYTKEANRVFNDILGFRSVYTNYDDVLAMELPEQFRISDMSHEEDEDDVVSRLNDLIYDYEELEIQSDSDLAQVTSIEGEIEDLLAKLKTKDNQKFYRKVYEQAKGEVQTKINQYKSSLGNSSTQMPTDQTTSNTTTESTESDSSAGSGTDNSTGGSDSNEEFGWQN